MINFCRNIWPTYPIGPEGGYTWDPEGETDRYWMTQLRNYLMLNKKEKEKPYLEVWFHARFYGPDPPPVSQFPLRKKEEESDEETRPVPSAPPAAVQQPPTPPALSAVASPPVNDRSEREKAPPPDQRDGEVTGEGGQAVCSPPPYQPLHRELQQLVRDVQNFPLPGGAPRGSPESDPFRRYRKEKSWGFSQAGVLGDFPVHTFPLRETPGGITQAGQPVMVYVVSPIKPSELRELKQTLPKLHENSQEVANLLQMWMGPHIYTYTELMYILGHLFTPEEKAMIRRAAMQYWEVKEAQRVAVNLGGQGPALPVPPETKFPIGDPNWDINNVDHRTHLMDLKEMILEGIKRAVPQSTNLTKAFEVSQMKEESPGDFIQRIRDHLTKYSGVAPDSLAFDNLLRMQFVTKAWPDIQKKLQKMDWQDAAIIDLVKTAQQVYVNREAVKSKQKCQMMAATLQKTWEIQKQQETEATRGRGGAPYRGRGRGRGGYTPGSSVVCYRCNKPGHFARECRTPRDQILERNEQRQGSQRPRQTEREEGTGTTELFSLYDE